MYGYAIKCLLLNKLSCSNNKHENYVYKKESARVLCKKSSTISDMIIREITIRLMISGDIKTYVHICTNIIKINENIVIHDVKSTDPLSLHARFPESGPKWTNIYIFSNRAVSTLKTSGAVSFNELVASFNRNIRGQSTDDYRQVSNIRRAKSQH